MIPGLNIERLAWILPHWNCPDPECKHVELLIKSEDIASKLKFAIDYINKKYGFNCKLCGKRFISLGKLDSHLITEECIDIEDIENYRELVPFEMQTIEDTLEEMEKIRKIIHNEPLRKEWSDSEIKTMITLRGEGKTNAEIGEVLKRKEGAVSVKISKLIEEGLIEKKRVEWTAEEIERLITLRNEGKKAKELATIFGKSSGSVSQRICILIKEGKLNKSTSEIDDETVISYVKDYYKESSIIEIAKTLEITSATIYNKLSKKFGSDWKKQLGLEEDTQRLPVVKHMKRQSMTEIKAIVKAAKKVKKEKEKLKPQKAVKISSTDRKLWTAHEIKILMMDKPLAEIANHLGRTYNACAFKRHNIRHSK